VFKRNDYIVAVAAILFGIFILLQSAQLEEQVKVSIDPAGPTALPNLMAFIIIAMGIVHLAGAYYANKVTEKGQSRSFSDFVSQYKAVAYVSIISIAYAFLMDIIGYIILTPLLIGSLLWVVQVRDLKRIVRVSTLMTGILFIVFRFGLQVKLPLGLLDFFLG